MHIIRPLLSNPFTLVFLALFVATCSMPIYIPDSYEQALGFLCRIQDHPSCTQSNVDFRPPAMSIALTPFAMGMSPFLAVGATSLLCAAWAIFPIASTIKSHTRSNILMWFGVSAILVSPTIQLLTSLADARIFILPFLFGAWALLFKESTSKYTLLLSGLLMGIAATTRPELVLGIILLSGFSIYLHRKKSLWTIIGSSSPYFLWVAILSVRAQKLVFAPRHWEGALLGIWNFIPQRLALRLYGMGMYSPKARDIESLVPTTHTLNFQSGWSWIIHIASMSPVIFVLGSIFIIFGLRTHKKISLAAIAISLPYLIAAFLPQARAPLFPQANMIPVLIILFTSVGVCIGSVLFTQKLRSLWMRVSIALCIVILHSATATLPESPTGIEYTSCGVHAKRFIQNAPPSIYRSSYENAALIWTATQQWQQYNSPWEENMSTYTLRSSIDLDIPPDETPLAFWADGDNWVLLSYSE